MSVLLSEKAVFSTKEAWAYCGSRPLFEQLQREFPDLIKPFSTGKSIGKKSDGTPKQGKTTYLKAVIDQALKAAQMDGRFVR